MKRRIEIKGEGVEGLSQEYFKLLFDKYRIKGAKVKYEPRGNLPNHPSSRARGVVTVTGDFLVSDVYSAITHAQSGDFTSRNFIITKINEMDFENPSWRTK